MSVGQEDEEVIGMGFIDIMIIVATILGIAFPAYLINAIRSSDEDIASNNKVKACMVFGALVFILLAMVNS